MAFPEPSPTSARCLVGLPVCARGESCRHSGGNAPGRTFGVDNSDSSAAARAGPRARGAVGCPDHQEGGTTPAGAGCQERSRPWIRQMRGQASNRNRGVCALIISVASRCQATSASNLIRSRRAPCSTTARSAGLKNVTPGQMVGRHGLHRSRASGAALGPTTTWVPSSGRLIVDSSRAELIRHFLVDSKVVSDGYCAHA